MQLSKIEVERFKGLKKLSFSILEALQIVAGPNNAGKSTLITSLDLFFSIDGKYLDPEIFAPKNTYYQDGGPRLLTRIKLTFNKLTDIEKESFSNAISVRNDSFWVELRISKQGHVDFKASNKADGLTIYNLLTHSYRVIHVPVLRISDTGFASTESKRLYSTIHEVLVRKRPGRDSTEQAKFKRHYHRLQKVVESVFKNGSVHAKAILPKDTSLKFSTPDINSFLVQLLSQSAVSTDNASNRSLKDEGSGFQSLMALGLLNYVVSSNKKTRINTLILLEEPEAFLHPQYQRKIAEYIERLSDSSQVIMTTHSPIIIDCVDISVVGRLKRDPNGLVHTWNATTLTDTEIGRLERFCDVKNSELVFADKIILCEGATDSRVINRVLRFKRFKHQRLDSLSVIELGGKGTVHHFANLCRRFEIPYLVVADRDFYAGDRGGLRNLIQTTNFAIPPNFWADLDTYKNTIASTTGAAATLRDKVNNTFSGLHCFLLSSDMEGAVLTSIQKKKLIDAIGPGKLNLQDAVICAQLTSLSGVDYYDRIFALNGSKGWKNAAPNKENCPKPHVMTSIINQVGKITVNSDMAKLAERMKEFLT